MEIRGVEFSYNGQTALSNVNLTIRDKDFIAVIGPNGGGKSTLLKLILGLLKPDRGQIRVMGGSPGKFSPDIGYVPQNVHINDKFPITALDVVLMGCLNPRGRQPKKSKARKREAAMDTLDRLHMAGQAHKRIGEMSGGQRQRVFIARSLMTHPRLLLLDEPTASIDTKGQTDFYRLLETLNQDVAILVVSHDLVMVSRHVKSVACVNQGLHYHPHEEITGEMLEAMYACSVEDVCRARFISRGIRKQQAGKEGDSGNPPV